MGEVSELRQVATGTLLELELDEDAGPIHRDATVLIRAKSIAEENYVELDPGRPSAGALPEGGTLPADRALEATQHDDVLSIFDAPRRRDLQRTLDGTGRGLARSGARDLNRTLEATEAITENGADLARILAQEREHVAGLVDAFGRVTQALGDRRAAIRLLTRRARSTAEAVAARDAQLRDMLATLPPLLEQGRTTANRLAAFSVRATPVMRDLRLATEDLGPTVTDLRPAAREARTTVAELDRFARAGTPALERLPAFAGALEGFAGPYGQLLRHVNPFVGYLEPYFRELTNWFALNGAHTAAKDELGHAARVLLPISRSNLPGQLSEEQEAFVRRLTGDLDSRGSNAFPQPGEAGGAKPPSRPYPRLLPEPPYGP